MMFQQLVFVAILVCAVKAEEKHQHATSYASVKFGHVHEPKVEVKHHEEHHNTGPVEFAQHHDVPVEHHVAPVVHHYLNEHHSAPQHHAVEHHEIPSVHIAEHHHVQEQHKPQEMHYVAERKEAGHHWNRHEVPVVHHDVPVVHHVVPEVHHAAPTVHHIAPTVHHDVSEVHHAAPTVHHVAPTVHHVAPLVHHVAPLVHHVAPEIHHAAPEAHHTNEIEEVAQNEIAEEHYPHHPTKYEFKYGVEDHKTKDIHSHHETSDGDVVKGEYMLRQPDGVVRLVKYYADKKTGFKADVSYSGHADHPEHHQEEHQHEQH